MNEQNPYIMPDMMPNYQGGPGPAIFGPRPPFGPGPSWNNPNQCNCKEQIGRLDNRITRLERQVRRLENRLASIPMPLMATEQDSNDYNSGYML